VESRTCLKKIASFNGVVYNDNFTFDTEEELSIIKSERGNDSMYNSNTDQNDSLIPSNQQSPTAEPSDEEG